MDWRELRRLDEGETYKLKLVNDVHCQDWKTDSIHPKDPVPEGTKVEGKLMSNLYGHFFEVWHEGRHYYVHPRDVERGD